MTSGGRLSRRQNHHHLPVFHPGHLLDLGRQVHLRPDPFQHAHADVLMRHLAAAKAQSHLDLVAFINERLHGAHLHLIVVLINVRANLDLLDLNDFLLLLSFVLLFLLFVFELAEVQDLAHRRVGVRADLDQIKADGEGALHRFARAHDTLHLALLVDQTDLRYPDFLIYAWAVAGWRSGQWSSCYRCLLWLFRRSAAALERAYR